jgi:hypothetical protein
MRPARSSKRRWLQTWRNTQLAVDDIREVVRRLQQHVGELAQYERAYLLCYLRGPSGIIVALAEALG